MINLTEQLSMQLVYSQTCIPLPRAHRVIRPFDCEDSAYLVMDYLPNAQRLQTAWKSLLVWSKLRVIVTLRIYLRQLRRVKHPSMGRPGPPRPKPLGCKGLQFDDSLCEGPFATPVELAGYYRKTHERALKHVSLGWGQPVNNPAPADRRGVGAMGEPPGSYSLRDGGARDTGCGNGFLEHPLGEPEGAGVEENRSRRRDVREMPGKVYVSNMGKKLRASE
ncbi:hypothetical protein DXG03_005706 [Asterophora parasitica]|uniref:Uncharacterized protein n=1 Tax=Asterophora parasitica TaxID=117018 RepID=A0A9P7KCH0_9AGAR|nr:hypothetical protein DXG03_005706 [Asterophora parasitica]